jgi:DNA-binding winged helix-turn-helix (wHTH) protein/WD40 repeat protein
MGVVWRAFDLKLEVEVALKTALHTRDVVDKKRVELLRREVRSAREVHSPNVCRIYDLIEIDGTELVSMEYVEGRTLRRLLEDRSPLDLDEALDIATQFLAGLEAIHQAGLVHRDVKPENIMITPSGRVVVMDFGLARQESTGTGTVSGTPAYMAPEQAVGRQVDARADVYSAGVVLAEMVSPEGVKSQDSRQSLWEGVRSDPPELPKTPWTPVLKRAVAREPEERCDSAQALIRALEDLSLRQRDELRSFQVGEWLVEPSLNRLSRGDETVRLDLKSMDLLRCLAESAGEVVSTQQLVDRVWQVEVVAVGTLTHAVAELRKALGDDARRPSYIETIPKRGYRLIAEVSFEVAEEPQVAEAVEAPVPDVAVEEPDPYPGLAAFTEADAEFFYGREAEVAQLWRKLTGRRLLAVIGPSGVGKSSFVRAGVLPTAPEGWAAILCKPGEAPLASLARALVPEFEGEREAIEDLVGLSDPDGAVAMVSRWRDRHDQALLVVDQFEELFTLCPPEVQRSFAGLLRRLVQEVGVHALIVMRDDFMYRCHELAPLRPIFEDMTPLAQPSDAALRRALTEPAARLGYSFEGDLAHEMVAEVREERGALPLLAFAVARLWDKRDREDRSLTRAAYQDIGGVGGALARHAEATLSSIGTGRHSMVRELFRNLVTAEGTRAVRDSNELLSVFPEPQRDDAREVLRRLIDARLLTSYELHGEDEAPERRIEIIHESLLEKWPRLVRWRTQDADAAQLRDQLRQAARTWDERERSDDMLWTGSAYREFALWRERYPGGLSETEEAFGEAMTSLAGRRRTRRRMGVTAIIVALVTGLSVVGTLWQRGIRETRRAEAQKLVALAQVQLEDFPTAALAIATKSLELADSEEARFLALRALWEGPTAFIVNETPSIFTSFSPGGNWLVQTHDRMSSLTVISRDGIQTTMDHPTESGKTRVYANFGHPENVFWSAGTSTDWGRVALWSAPEGRLLASAKLLDGPDGMNGAMANCVETKKPRAIFAAAKGDLLTVDALHVDGSHEKLGELRMKAPIGLGWDFRLDLGTGNWLAVVEGNDVSILSIGDNGLSERRPLGRHEGDSDFFDFFWTDPLGRFFLTVTGSGGIRRWDPDGEKPPVDIKLPSGVQPLFLSDDGSYLFASTIEENETTEMSIWSFDESGIKLLRRFDDDFDAWIFDPTGSRLVARGPLPAHRLWWLGAPAGSEPIVLRRGPAGYTHMPSFSPDGRWLATNDMSGLIMWPVGREQPAVIPLVLAPWSNGLDFAPDGRFLATSAFHHVRVWPLVGPVPPAGHVVYQTPHQLLDLAVSPDGETFAAGEGNSGAVYIGRDDEEPLNLADPENPRTGTTFVSFSQDGRFVAAMAGLYDMASAAVYVWEVATGEEIAELSLDDAEFRYGCGFATDGRLLTATSKGVLAWDVATGEYEVLVEARVKGAVASDDGRRLLLTEEGEGGLLTQSAGAPKFFDLDTGIVVPLSAHGTEEKKLALDRNGTMVVTGDSNGVVRVGRVSGEEPHILLGHDKEVLSLAVDPLGRWIASAGMDETVRLWPMPDLSKPPLHTLPREELISKLKTLTNLRFVRDDESSAGWTLTHDPFPGWKTVPTW